MKDFHKLLTGLGISLLAGQTSMAENPLSQEFDKEILTQVRSIHKLSQAGLNLSCSGNRGCHAPGPEGQPEDLANLISLQKENGLNSSCSNNKGCHAPGPEVTAPEDLVSVVAYVKETGLNKGCSGNSSCHATGSEEEPMDTSNQTL